MINLRKVAGTMPEEQKTVTINIRLDAALLARIDEQVEAAREKILYFSRNQMINLLLLRGLDDTENGAPNGIYTDRE